MMDTAPGDLRRLALGSAHAPPARRTRTAAPPGFPSAGMPSFSRPALSRVLKVPWTMALGPDVHPAPGGHLAVVGHPQSGGPVEVLLVVEGAHHQAVGDDAPGGQLVGVEQPQGVAGHDHQGLLVGHHLQYFLDEAILHPVLQTCPVSPVGHQLIGVEGHVEVQVVVDHHLEGPGLHRSFPCTRRWACPRSAPPGGSGIRRSGRARPAPGRTPPPSACGAGAGCSAGALRMARALSASVRWASRRGARRQPGTKDGYSGSSSSSRMVMAALGSYFHGTDLLSFFVRLWYHRKNRR